MRKIWKIRLTVIIGVLLLFGFIVFHLPNYLKINKPVNSNVLVIEGWLSDDAIEEAANLITTHNYRTIFTTGGPLPADYQMLSNGTFVFNGPIQITENKLIVNAYGDQGDKKNAHFSVSVNDSIIGDTYASCSVKPYIFKIPACFRLVKSIKIKYDNDFYSSKKNDRNLYLHSIILNHKEYPPRSDNNYFITSTAIIPAYKYFAKKAAFELKQMVKKNCNIIAIPSEEKLNGRTITSAQVLYYYLKKSNTHYKQLNLLSEGIHCRRSWIVYKYVFRNETEIGIIAANDITFGKRWWKHGESIKRLFRELTGNIYYQGALWFGSPANKL